MKNKNSNPHDRQSHFNNNQFAIRSTVLMVCVSIGRRGSGLVNHHYIGIHTSPQRIENDETLAENRARKILGAPLADVNF